MATEKQIVHDWSSGVLVIYEIDAEVIESSEPPSTETEIE
jgi:hypothetical protein